MPPTAVTECSSLLPTPTASEATGPGAEGREGGLNLRTEVALLPTPCERDWRDGADFTPHAEKIKLTHTVKLLPTPAADNPRGTIEQYRERLRRHDKRTSTFVPLSMIGGTLPDGATTPPPSPDGSASSDEPCPDPPTT